MSGPMNNQKMPSGECHGRDLPDRGNRTGVTNDYGAGGAMDTGHMGAERMGSATKSDGKKPA